MLHYIQSSDPPLPFLHTFAARLGSRPCQKLPANQPVIIGLMYGKKPSKLRCFASFSTTAESSVLCVLQCIAVCDCCRVQLVCTLLTTADSTKLWCVMVCCGTLWCVAVCCGVLRCVAVCCSVHRHHLYLLISCYDVESPFLGLCMCMYMTE